MTEPASRLMLVSFQHQVAAVIDGRILSIWCAVCEEIFKTETSIRPKDQQPPQREVESFLEGQARQIDIPIMLRVLSLGDGKRLTLPIEIMVKWSNVSAICNFEESWIKPNIVAARVEKKKLGEKERAKK
jgi:hypothetical protein